MKFFVTGVCGQLGYDVMEQLNKRGHEAVGSDLTSSDNAIHLDIKKRDDVVEVISKVNPDVVIHCAAWTAVDAAEEQDNKDIVRKVNSGGTENIAYACKKLNCKMLYISTDYVFDGSGDIPWKADCKNYNPLNYYGQTKLDGEIVVERLLEKYFIVRTEWVFGLYGNNFVKTMVDLARNHDEIKVVNDQIGAPTYTYDLARLLVDICESDKYGVYHATNEGGCVSWYDFCVEIYRQCGFDTKVTPVSTEEYGLNKAIRPKNSRLDKSKLIDNGFQPLPTWQDALSRYLISLHKMW